jgi:hypothetical protein
VQEQELRQAMSQAALETASSRTWSEAMQSLLKGYEMVVAQNRPLIAA